jgi:hypothetical protein
MTQSVSYLVRLPVTEAQADVAGMPRSIFERAVARLGSPVAADAYTPLPKFQPGQPVEPPLPSAPMDGGLLRVVEHCEETFRRYAKGHAEKGTREGDEKAAANECLAAMCAAALATERARVKALPVLIGHVKGAGGREVGFVGLVHSPGPGWEPAYTFRPEQ